MECPIESEVSLEPTRQNQMRKIWAAHVIRSCSCGVVGLLLLAGASVGRAGDQISAHTLETHVQSLASDAFEGRGTGEPGISKAERYVAREFARYGLSPLPGRSDFFLPFELYRAQFDPEKTRLRLNDPSETLAETRLVGDDFRVFPFSDGGEASGEIVFAGYGVSAPDLGYDDYAGLDVSGKFVLVLRHEPEERNPDSVFDGTDSSSHALFTTKAEEAQTRGALGMILVTDPLHHTEADDFRTGGRLYLDSEDAMAVVVEATDEGSPDPTAETSPSGETPSSFLAIQISRELADRVVAVSGRTLLEIQRDIEDDFTPVRVDLKGVRMTLEIDPPTDIRIIPARNVAGFIEGSDPDLRDEWVVIGGHHDHLGAFEGDGDTVYNGADDNASGTAAVLQLAEVFSEGKERPRRSIVFATFSAEERGLLGSKAMIEQEQIDVEKTVFMFNFDMIGRNPGRAMTLMGDGYSRGLTEVADAALNRIDLEVSLSGLDYQGNSDHNSFYSADIPFLNFFTGLHDDYHQLGDHLSYLDFSRMESIVRLGRDLAREVVDRDERFQLIHLLPWMGVLAEVTTRDGLELPFLSQVDPDSRAALAGLEEGDVVRKVNGEYVDPAERIGDLLRAIEPGTTASLEIERAGGSSTIKVDRAHTGYLGIFPGPVDEDQHKQYGLKSNEGLLVRQVVTDGPAAESGLEDGDLILQVAGRIVDLSNLSSVLAQIGAWETVDVVVLRGGERISFPLTLGERPRRRG